MRIHPPSQEAHGPRPLPSITTLYSKPRVGHYPGEEGCGRQESGVHVSWSGLKSGGPWLRWGSFKQIAALCRHRSATAGALSNVCLGTRGDLFRPARTPFSAQEGRHPALVAGERQEPWLRFKVIRKKSKPGDKESRVEEEARE